MRYHERIGLNSPAQRAKSGYRSYSEEDLRRLLLIRRARAIDFSIEEIAELMALQTKSNSGRARSLIDNKVASIDAKLTELRCWRAALMELRTLTAGVSLEALLMRQLENHTAHAAQDD